MSDAQLEIRARVLEHIVEGGKVSDTLDLICRETEALHPDIQSAVLSFDLHRKRIRLAAAPGLPGEFKLAVDGLDIADGVVSCAAAARTGELTIVEDILADPTWSSHATLAKEMGIRACWSQPIVSKRNEVLGTFSMFCGDARAPSAEELQILQSHANLAALALAHMREGEFLRDSGLTSRALLEGSPVCNKIIDLDSRLLYMSAAGIKMLKLEDVEPLYGSVYPPHFYTEPARASLTDSLERAKLGEICDVECPIYSLEGDEVWLHTTFVPARNDDGDVEYIIACSIDITKRKHAEMGLAS